MNNRLEEAMAVYLDWSESGSRVDAGELLAAHADLADLLRPLVYRDDAPQSAPEPAPDTGSAFGDYRLGRRLGRGGMGVVHEARQSSLGRSVALKILSPHLTHDPATLVRFRREASTAARLQHPGIAQVIEFGTVGDQHFLAMQLVRGASLEAILKDLRGRPLSEATGANILRSIETAGTSPVATGTDTDSADGAVTWTGSYTETVVRLVIQIAETLDYAHDEGVIHRDVKPSNILVQPNGRAVLVDFGLAREEGPSSLTLTGDFAGSPYYVSPEQGARRSSGLDRRSDVFSLGITLYEALTLQRPFEGASSHEIIDRIINADPAPPNRFNPSLPPDLAAIVLKALEKPVHRRYQTAGAFAEDLRAFLELRPVTARYPSRVSRLGRWIRREPVKALLVSMIVVATLLSVYVWASWSQRAAGERALLLAKVDETLAMGWFSLQTRDEAAARASFLSALELDSGNARAIFGYLYATRPGGAEGLAFLDRHAVEGRDAAAIAEIRDFYRPDQPEVAPKERAGDRSALATFIHAMYRLPAWGTSNSRQGFGRSLELLESVIYNATTPRFEHYMQLAFVASQLDDHRRARLCADALRTHWPDFAPAHVWIGVALRFTDPEQAIASYKRAIELDPLLYSAHFNLALCYGSQKRDDEALESARRAAEIRPELADAHSVVSLYLTRIAQSLRDPADQERRRGMYEEAVAAARRSVDLDPAPAQYVMQLAAALERAGDDAGAIEWCRRALEKEPQLARAHRSMIGMMRKTGDLAGERAEWKRWAEVNPTGPTAWREWADFLLARGSGPADLAEALRAAQAARRLSKGDDPFVLLTLAEAMIGNGTTEGVEELLDRADAAEFDDARLRDRAKAKIAVLRRRKR